MPEPPRIVEAAERALRRRETFPSQAEFVARYRAQDAFREWREDYFAAFVAHASVTREDGSVELCVPPRVAAAASSATPPPREWPT